MPGRDDRPGPPTPAQVEKFVRRCYLCHHWTWDVFESGMPMYAACRHPDHESLGWTAPACARVAEYHGGGKCPKFWPVVLRAPHRIALRVIRDVLTG